MALEMKTLQIFSRLVRTRVALFSSKHSSLSGLSLPRVDACKWLPPLLLFAMVISGWSQSVNFRASRVRLTLPPDFSGTIIITNLVTISTNTEAPVDFSVTDLPAGLTVQLTDANSNVLSSSLISTSLWMHLTAASVAPGMYQFNLNGTGGASNTLHFIVQVGPFWNGTTNAALDGAGNWSNPANWLGGVPGPSSEVVFAQFGTQTNSIVADESSTNMLVSSLVDVDAEIASLRFAQTNNIRFHTLRIDSGKTLSITGTNGFQFIRDYINEFAGLPGSPFVTIAGEKMVVSNRGAMFAVQVDGQITETLDMSQLNNLVVDVDRMPIGDYSAYPNYWNFRANEYANGSPRRYTPNFNMARTNVIRASYLNPDAYTNANEPYYAISFVSSSTSGTTRINNWLLGITNAFFADAVCVGGANQQCQIQFNPAFASNNPAAIFRNTNGGRMSVFGVGDGRGTNAASSNIKATCNFGPNGGTVDILADLFFLARDRALTSSDQAYQAEFYMGKGIVDVNSAYLGFQDQGGHTNNTTQPFRGYCQGILAVSNTAVFKVNEVMELGYTTETNSIPAQLLQRARNRGIVLIGPGGTVMVNKVGVGGITKWGGGTEGGGVGANGNGFNITAGGHLILSNTIAGPDMRLTTFSMSDSSLTLHINETNTQPYIYTTNIATAGSGNVINLASLPVFPSYPTQLTLISFMTGATPNFSKGSVPPGAFDVTILNNPNSVDVLITTNVPKSIIWTGAENSNWDFTSKNWKLEGPGPVVETNFNNGDFVRFDDSTVVTTINVTENVLPGQSVDAAGIVVSNSVIAIVFNNGGGSIQGSKLLKQGSNPLTLDSAMTSSLEIEEGTVLGAGAVGSTTVAAGSSLLYTGTINGSLTSAGNVSSAGTMGGPLVIQNGGAVTNLGTMTVSVSLQSGSLLVNEELASMTVTTDWSIPANSMLINNGTIVQSLPLTVSGTLAGNGSIERNLNNTPNIGTAPVNIGGVFSPGTSLGTNRILTRLNLNSGSTTRIELDIANGGNDLIVAGTLNFGSPPSPANIVVTNIGGGSFAAGQAFQIFTNSFGDPFVPIGGDPGWNTNNILLAIQPLTPGIGLRWDTTDLRTNGLLRVVSVSTTPVDIAFNITTFTNASSTNKMLSMSWPEDHLGWRLEVQTNTSLVGINTNWVNIPNSHMSNQISAPLDPDNPSVFYRLVHP
jgi:hypothetical protein